MKRFIMIASLSLGLTLSACSGSDTVTKDPDKDTEDNVRNEITEENLSNDEEHKVEDETEHENENENTSSDLAGFEEAEIVTEHIDAIDDYQIKIQTDNRNNRIILYEQDQIPHYKSIFIKNKAHLKIINLQTNSDLLFKGTI